MSAHSRLSPQSDTSPFVVDGFNAPELDSFIDFDLVPPLTSNESLPGKQQILQPTTAATSTSSGQPRSHFGLVGTTNPSQQQQQHLTPSFPYDLYQQQTGPLPVMYSSASSASSFSSLDLGMGLDVMDGTGMDSLNGASSASANDQGGNDFLDNMEQNTSLYNTPPYFFPETTTNGFSTTQAQSQQAQQAAASALSAPFTKTLPSNAMPIMPGAVLPPGARPYVGMHHDYAVQQQQAILARQKKEQELKAQQLKMAQQPKSKEELERERKIQALLQSIRVEPTPLAPNSAQKVLPHIARLKKEEDEMDEDERLLASEEGKKLTSKERRQLRNKVSARAFRSRRKEYISQLETEVEKKTNETISLQERVRALAQENERLQNLTRTLLQSPAFASFLDTVSGEAFLQQFEAQNGSSNNLRIPPPTDTRSMPKDVNPNVIQASSSSSSDINTAWPLDYNTTTTPMWNANPLVYRATDIPQPSVIQDSFGRAIITEDDYFNPLIATGKDAFSWINFPSPADGFRPSEKEPDVLPEEGCQLLSWAELYSNETGMTEFDPDAIVEYPETDLYLPEDLMDLYEAECGPSVPALSTSVTSSPSSSRSQSVSGLDSILEEEPSSSSAVPRKEKTFDEKDYRRMFLGIAEVIMGERMDLCRPSSSAPSSPASSSRNPFASTSNTIMVGASLVETSAPAAPKQEKTEFKPIPTEKKEVEVPKMSEEELVHGKVERALEAHLEHVQKVMDRVGRWCGL